MGRPVAYRPKDSMRQIKSMNHYRSVLQYTRELRKQIIGDHGAQAQMAVAFCSEGFRVPRTASLLMVQRKRVREVLNAFVEGIATMPNIQWEREYALLEHRNYAVQIKDRKLILYKSGNVIWTGDDFHEMLEFADDHQRTLSPADRWAFYCAAIREKCIRVGVMPDEVAESSGRIFGPQVYAAASRLTFLDLEEWAADSEGVFGGKPLRLTGDTENEPESAELESELE